VRVNGPHRILVISRRAAGDGATSRLVNSEPAKVRASLPGEPAKYFVIRYIG
jgi:hypothetical protein